ncbi:MAG: pyruvate formate-lyase-activating protein [Candidatus Izemoplasma sp.]|nr:pyruvate formate-lyase-activating protein [Candidatus Izemoplasma sp.]
MTLNVHSIESFGTVDGPGIRFVIFTQGCHMRCLYCHNPDTWEMNQGTEMSIDSLLDQIDDLKVFLKTGGVTVSGGEPLLQAKSIIPLFKALQERGIHTCLDTAGFVDLTEDVKTLLSYTDLVMIDIKHMDDDLHRDLTGVSHSRTLSLCRYLDQENIPIWVRHVLLPSVNDSITDLKALKDFLDSLDSLVKVEVLPYHTLGKVKWEALGYPYLLNHITPPSKSRIKEVKAYLRKNLTPHDDY